MAKPIRLALVGAGRVADVHLQAISRFPSRAVLCGFAEIREEARLARSKQWNVPGFDSVEALLASCSPDALLLLLPHHARLEAIRRCIAAQKPILLEKPLALSVEEGERIVAEVRQSGARLLVGHNGLYHPDFLRTHEIIEFGWIGKITSVRAESAGWLGFRPWDFRKRVSETGGGVWMDTGSHLIYSLMALVGQIEAIQCLTGKLARSEMEGEDHALLNLRFSSGALGQIFASYGHKQPGYLSDWPEGYALSIQVTGTLGSVKYELCPRGGVTLFSEHPEAPAGASKGWSSLAEPAPFSSSFERQMGHFLDVVEGLSEPAVSADNAMAVLRILRAAYTAEAAAYCSI